MQRRGRKNSSHNFAPFLPTHLHICTYMHVHTCTHTHSCPRSSISSVLRCSTWGSPLQGRMWCPDCDMGTALHVPFKAKDFSPLSKSVSQSKCLLNFKLNGHLKGDYSTPTVKEMTFLALLMLRLGSRFEGSMGSCLVLANIWRTAQSAFQEKPARTPLCSFSFGLVDTGIAESLTLKLSPLLFSEHVGGDAK